MKQLIKFELALMRPPCVLMRLFVLDVACLWERSNFYANSSVRFGDLPKLMRRKRPRVEYKAFSSWSVTRIPFTANLLYRAKRTCGRNLLTFFSLCQRLACSSTTYSNSSRGNMIISIITAGNITPRNTWTKTLAKALKWLLTSFVESTHYTVRGREWYVQTGASAVTFPLRWYQE